MLWGLNMASTNHSAWHMVGIQWLLEASYYSLISETSRMLWQSSQVSTEDESTFWEEIKPKFSLGISDGVEREASQPSWPRCRSHGWEELRAGKPMVWLVVLQFPGWQEHGSQSQAVWAGRLTSFCPLGRTESWESKKANAEFDTSSPRPGPAWINQRERRV